MTDETKNLWDVVLNMVTMVGAAVAFGFGLQQWRKGQAWQRADKLDKFIEKFEADPLLRLAATILDWKERNDITFGGEKIDIRNNDVLLALRDHHTIAQRPMFSDEQAKFRDAYDALLAFLNRLELSITTDLIDPEPTRAYFAYWLERLLEFNRHPDREKVLGDFTPSLAVVQYIKVYGDVKSVIRLCEHFKISVPGALTECSRST